MIRPKHIILFFDLILAYACFLLACLLRFGSLDSVETLSNGGLSRVSSYLVCVLFATYFFELYDIQKYNNRAFVMRRTLFAALISFFLLVSIEAANSIDVCILNDPHATAKYDRSGRILLGFRLWSDH